MLTIIYHYFLIKYYAINIKIIMVNVLFRSIKGFIECKYKSRNQLLPLVLTGTCILIAFIVYAFSHNDLIIFLIFVSLVPIFAIWKFDGRIPIAYAILLLALAAGIQSFGYPLALFSYWLLLAGISCLVIDLLKNNLEKAGH